MSALELRGVWARYAGRDPGRPVLAGVDLALGRGECVALIGPNGAGKSTVLRIAGGALRPTAGAVLLDGVDLRSLSPRQVALRVATVPQESPLPPGLSARELVMLGRTPHVRLVAGPTRRDRACVDWALEATAARDLADCCVDELSGGERQRVLLARALAQEPQLLLLDEPTANLDLHHQVAILDLVRGLARARGLAILAAVHDLQLAALYGDRVVLLRGGAVLAQGAPEAVLTAPRLRAAFEQDVVLSPHPTHGVPLVALVPNGEARRLPSAQPAPG